MALINTTTTGVLGSTFFGDGTGPLTIQQNGVTLGVFGKIPVISLALSSSPTLTSSTWTKLNFDTRNIDTDNLYSTSTYRFTPNVAGYYFVAYSFASGSSNIRGAQGAIYKNGSQVAVLGQWVTAESYGDDLSVTVTKVLYMNGTSDYLEFYGYAYDSVVGSDTVILAQTSVDSFLVRAV
jgi:hypothetical protein